VRECAVVGLPDDKWVEAVTAVVMLAPGHAESDALAAELIAQVAGRLASYKKPRRVIFVEQIPKTAVGKLNRRALRDSLRAASDPARQRKQGTAAAAMARLRPARPGLATSVSGRRRAWSSRTAAPARPRPAVPGRCRSGWKAPAPPGA
jgi:hypothetical protein